MLSEENKLCGITENMQQRYDSKHCLKVKEKLCKGDKKNGGAKAADGAGTSLRKASRKNSAVFPSTKFGSLLQKTRWHFRQWQKRFH